MTEVVPRYDKWKGIQTKTLVCVDDVVQGEVEGRLLNPYIPKEIRFQNVTGMLSGLEQILQKVAYPQSSIQYRSFADRQEKPQQNRKEPVRYMDDIILENEKGEKASFMIQIQYRQNATWQGIITWIETQKTQRFRSMLEMIKLMNDALGNGAENEPVEW